ncbi:MAG TPA: SRPBCC domain-containing protein [Acidisarcina sp.]
MIEAMAAEGLKLEVKRVIRADRSRVFSAWTNPEILKKWFGPATMITSAASADPRAGGSYRIEMQRIEQRTAEMQCSDKSTATGVYEQIIPNELLSFTWHGNWVVDEETLVTVRFKDVAGGTEVTLTHEHFSTADLRDRHEQGWTGSLEKLTAYLEG